MITDLAGAARLRSLQAGEVLVEQHAEADEVYVVVSGSLVATTASKSGEVVVGTVGAGQVVGEVTVIAGGHRTATLRAVDPTEVLAIARSDFERWLTEHEEAADEVSAEARARIDRAHVAAMVSELVGDAEPATVQSVVDRVEWRRLAAGEVLFRQGDPSDAAYFVVAGRLLVAADDGDGVPLTIAELGRGQVVGELGLLDRAPRSATARAVRDTTLARFGTAVFDELVMRSPALMLHVARGLLTRLRRTPRRTLDRAASLAIAVTAPADGEEIVAGVVEAIRRFGTVRRLSSARIDDVLNRPGIAQVERDDVGVPRLSELLHEADVGNDHVVLEVDPELTAWTRRAVRQADRVVVVCSPQPTGAERARVRALLDEVRDLPHIAVMLAVLHPPTADRPRATAALLDDFGVDEVVHVRAGSAADLARLGRLASGHGIGLVLSGGGARGFAHLGAYRALREAGVPIDAICGCSIGSTIAACIAMGTPDDEQVPMVLRQFHRLLDYTLPVVSLMKGERISASIEAAIGGWDIEDFVLPFYCVSTNLTQSRLEVHRRGSAARAVRASIAIPGILPPVPFGGDLLVDGGVLDNMPFRPMRDDPRIGTVIAVDVAPARGPRANSDYGSSVSGFRALVGHARRGTVNPYPAISAVLLRSMLVGAVHNQRESLRDGAVDLLLRLDLPRVGLLDFERVVEVEAAGYGASTDAIVAWARQAGWMVPA